MNTTAFKHALEVGDHDRALLLINRGVGLPRMPGGKTDLLELAWPHPRLFIALIRKWGFDTNTHHPKNETMLNVFCNIRWELTDPGYKSEPADFSFELLRYAASYERFMVFVDDVKSAGDAHSRYDDHRELISSHNRRIRPIKLQEKIALARERVSYEINHTLQLPDDICEIVLSFIPTDNVTLSIEDVYWMHARYSVVNEIMGITWGLRYGEPILPNGISQWGYRE